MFLTSGFDAEFYELTAAPVTNQEKHTELHIFCIH